MADGGWEVASGERQDILTSEEFYRFATPSANGRSTGLDSLAMIVPRLGSRRTGRPSAHRQPRQLALSGTNNGSILHPCSEAFLDSQEPLPNPAAWPRHDAPTLIPHRYSAAMASVASPSPYFPFTAPSRFDGRLLRASRCTETLACAGCRVGALIFTLLFPSALTEVYFVALDPYPAAVQRTAYAVLKSIQFLFPVVWVLLVARERLQWPARPWRGWVRGLGLGLAVAGIMLVAYFGWLGPAGDFARLPRACGGSCWDSASPRRA